LIQYQPLLSQKPVFQVPEPEASVVMDCVWSVGVLV
jgi:hypothetical protein